jgi:hypothetical protein
VAEQESTMRKDSGITTTRTKRKSTEVMRRSLVFPGLYMMCAHF